jgi:hypothetical protein
MMCYLYRIRPKIEDSPYAFDNLHEAFVAGQVYLNGYPMGIWFMPHRNGANRALNFDRSPITIVFNRFHSRDRIQTEKPQNLMPAKGGTVWQANNQAVSSRLQFASELTNLRR